jgi:acetyl-CoA acetyltransferase
VSHPFHEVAIAAGYNTEQARVLEGHDSDSIAVAAAGGALAEAGLEPSDVDGVAGRHSEAVTKALGLEPRWTWDQPRSTAIPAVLAAGHAIATKECETVLLAWGGAGLYTERAATAPWTRPNNQFTAPFGMFTAVEFALMARRHMIMYDTLPEQLATVAATIRNNGHVNPGAVYYGRGPYTVDDILTSRMVADPFHLLDCAMTAEGGAAVVLTTADRARDLKQKPVYVLGGDRDYLGQTYDQVPAWDYMVPELEGEPAGYVGRLAARRSFAMAGVTRDDVSVCEFYDPFSFEIIRQFEAFGFCGEGEGGEFVMNGTIEVGGRCPITTDGGLMSFSHGGAMVQLLQRAIRGVQQVRGECVTRQVEGAEVAMCTGGGAGALFNDVLLLGKDAA